MFGFPLRRLSILTKMFIAPTLILGLLLAMGVVSHRQAAEQREATDHLVNVIQRRIDLSQEALHAATLAHSNLSRLLAIAGSGIEDVKQREFGDALNRYQQETRRQLETLRGESLQQGEAALLQDAAARLEAYGKAAAQVAQMADLDRNLALPFLAQADRAYDELSAALHALLAAEKKLGAEGFAAAAANSERAAGIFLVLMVAAVVLSVTISLLVGRAIAQPVRRMAHSMTRLAHDHDVVIPAQDHTDEVGEMARAMLVFQANRQEIERQKRGHADEQRRAAEENRRALEHLAENFRATVQNVVQMVAANARQVHADATTLLNSLTQSDTATQAAADASRAASAQVAAAAGATDRLSATIGAVRQQVDQSVAVARRARDAAEGTGEMVRSLDQTSGRIGEVVKMITDIAGQTNLLALNATIEAARAGDAGKGFAVVANEVKNLASQTGRATDDVTRQVTSIQSNTREVVSAIDTFGGVIGEVNAISAAIVTVIEQQQAMTGEIVHAVAQALSNASSVATRMNDVAAVSTAAGQAARQVLGSAGDLSELSTTLQSALDKFLDQLRQGTALAT